METILLIILLVVSALRCTYWLIYDRPTSDEPTTKRLIAKAVPQAVAPCPEQRHDELNSESMATHGSKR